MHNQLCLTGVVCKQPWFRRSPAGIQHSYCVVEHRSKQQEATLQRRVYVRLRIVAVGDDWSTRFAPLTIGNTITVQGFIARHLMRNGLHDLVLHLQALTLEETL